MSDIFQTNGAVNWALIKYMAIVLGIVKASQMSLIDIIIAKKLDCSYAKISSSDNECVEIV